MFYNKYKQYDATTTETSNNFNNTDDTNGLFLSIL